MGAMYTHCRYFLLQGEKELFVQISIQKWGNSLALRIPQVMAKEARLKQGGKADLRLTGGKLVIMPLARKVWTLRTLLAGIKKQNLHGEIKAGGPVGCESW